MQTQEFAEAYKRLNTEQKIAVDTIEGPVMVIAGPGTGKTQILTLRIANILLKTDMPPEAILALTFTDSGVRSMKERLTTLIGSSGYRVNIFTFHGLANYIIEQYPERFPVLAGATVASDADRLQIVEEIITEGTFKLLKPFGDPLHYVPSLISEISSLKRENIKPEIFKVEMEKQKADILALPDLLHEKGAHKGKVKAVHQKSLDAIEKNFELGNVYTQYEKKLRERKLFDFEDMIILLTSALEEDEEFRLILQEEYQYILADEHQDANSGQNKILELLSSFHENPNLFVVGDEKQAIYRFQGASLANFLYFKELYPEAQVISLSENYRSTQHILDAAHSLIGNNAVHDEKLRVKLSANSQMENVKLAYAEVENQEEELHFLAQDIKRTIEGGADEKDIAVLVKENKDTFMIARYLTHYKIASQNLSQENLLADSLIERLVVMLRALDNPLEDVWFSRMLHAGFLSITAIEAYSVIAQAKKEKVSCYEAFTRSNIAQAEKDKFESWLQASKRETALRLLTLLIEDTEYVYGENPLDLVALEKVKAFFTFAERVLVAKKQSRLDVLLKEIEVMVTYNIALPYAGKESLPGVRIMTAHKSKGREYAHVYIPFCRDGYWGGKRKIHKFDIRVCTYANRELAGAMDDERRLFYVALTRGKERVVLTMSRLGSDGREYIPSVFIDEITPEYIETIDVAVREDIKADLVLERKANPVGLYDPQFIRELFLERGFSVTALNNFFACGWQFFYRNLIRLPSTYSKHQSYGNAVHAALHTMYRVAKQQDARCDKGVLMNAFVAALKREVLTDQEREELLEKGKHALEIYFDTYESSFKPDALTEYTIKGVSVPVVCDGEEVVIPLNGKIDKIEEGSDGISVTDYKTGRHKTHNEIMGKTANSDGGYFRQLIFYRILTDLQEDRDWKFGTGEIIFLEPDSKKRQRIESFEVSDDDVSRVKEEIAEAAQAILALDFEKYACGDKDCEYCQLAKVQKNGIR